MKVGDWVRNSSLRELFNFYDPRMLYSTPDYRADILGRDIDGVPITDFFGSVLDVQLHYDEEAYPLDGVDSFEESVPEIAQKSTNADANSTEVQIGASPVVRLQQQEFHFSTEFFLAGLAFVLGMMVVTNKKI